MNRNEQIMETSYLDKVSELISQRYPNKQPLAHVHSYGCQQNVSDGEKLKGILACMGYGFTDTTDDADFILYNTCAVREHAQDRVFGNVGALKNLKKQNKGLIIGLCGCMMQQDHVVEKIKKSYPYVDVIFGTDAIHRVPETFYKFLSEQKRVFDTDMKDGTIVEGMPIRRDGEIKAWLPIMYGCDNFCSYCVVPYVRGRERSRRADTIINETKEIVAAGFKEIMLLGQNVNSYGKGLDTDISFAKLLREINSIPGDFRVRFMTSHPKDATKELIDTIASCDKICNQLHLPFQSGNNRILREMNRGYNIEQYLELIEYTKNKIPNIGLSSDIIVGFPGETEQEFEDTLRVVERIEFDNLFTFIYSPREGTRAKEMSDPIPLSEKSKWLTRLLDIQRDISMNNNEKRVGKVLSVLADCEGKSGAEYLMGRCEENTIVEFKAPQNLLGTFVDVEITQARNWAVIGNAVQ